MMTPTLNPPIDSERADAANPPEFAYQIIGEALGIAPRSIYGIGRNYLKHIEELKNQRPSEPVIFLKSQGALRHFGAVTSFAKSHEEFAFRDEGVHYEAEITVLVGKVLPTGHVATKDHIRALGLGLDLTRRQVQDQLKSQGLPWARAKNFAGSAMVTPFCGFDSSLDLGHLKFSFSVGQSLRQQGSSDVMIFPILELLTALATLHPLSPGDLIFTGTPEGVGPLKAGDQLELAWTAPWNLKFSQIF